MKSRSFQWMAVACLLGAGVTDLRAQSEANGWGNLRGIRVADELVPFTTAVGIYNPDFTQLTLSQREGPTRTTQFVRDGNAVTIGIHLQYRLRSEGNERNGPPATPTTPTAAGQTSVAAATLPATNPTTSPTARRQRGNAPGPGIDSQLTYTDSAAGECDVHVKVSSAAAIPIGGVYYFLSFPSADYADATAQLIGGSNSAPASLATPDEHGRFLAGGGTGFRLTSKSQKTIEVDFPRSMDVVVQQSSDRDAKEIQVYFPIFVGAATAGQSAEASFKLKVQSPADTQPVTITLDPSKTGRPFDGIGGNYRIQSQQDPVHIQYIFDHLRVAYGRVALPWNVWQPEQNSPPPMINAAPGQSPDNGRGGMSSIVAAMEIAQTLSKKNIPMVISCWSPPQWATLPNPNSNNGGGGGGGGNRGGQRLDPAKWQAMSESIGSYLLYLRDHYGAEPLLFSFNESNIGINVRQSPEEHDEAIKQLGAHFKAIGLKTKILLGDTGDVPPINFIHVALNDPEAAPYIGAVSFHSWRGATDAQYQLWADAAAKLNVPLLDAEGGNDAQAYGYANIFREPWYSLDEAAEYVRIMRICQPQSILQWQFTENYSVLYIDSGGTVHPTQRFFNLKQMNKMPAGSLWTAIESSSPTVLPAAFVDAKAGVYTTHLVNNGASREITLKGLPTSLATLNMYVTDHDRGMEKLESVQVRDGSAHLKLPGQAFVTLIND